jgi:flagellar protein FlgJ
MIKPVSPAAALQAKAMDLQLRKAAEGFEAVFLREMIGSMRKAKLAEDDLFGSSATDNFRELADANLADSMSGLGLFGISALVEAQIAKLGVKP